MSEPLLFFVGNRDPSIQETLTTAGGTVYDLTGATVKFKMRPVGSSTLKVDAPATVVLPATDGKVQYDWAAADVDTAGFYLAWWEVTKATKTQDMNEAAIEFRAHAPLSKTLAEVEDVRRQMGVASSDRELDARIKDLLPVASDEIANYTQREFFASNGLTRDLPLLGIRDGKKRVVVELAPFDLRTATTVTIDPGGADQAILAAADYQLHPIGADEWGVYSELVLSSSVAMPTALSTFGEATIRILGDWGMPSVPLKAKQACIVTVRAWVHRDTPSAFQDPQQRLTKPDAPRNYALPRAAKNLLTNLRRQPI